MQYDIKSANLIIAYMHNRIVPITASRKEEQQCQKLMNT